jgi:hypothetical protein
MFIKESQLDIEALSRVNRRSFVDWVSRLDKA